jgi:hypothetical protein
LILFLTSSISPLALNYPLSKSALYKTVSYWTAFPFAYLKYFTSCVAFSSALKVEIAGFSETSVPVCHSVTSQITAVVSSTRYCYVALLRLLFYGLCGVYDVTSVGDGFPTFRTNTMSSYSMIQVPSVYSVHLKAKTALCLDTSETNCPLLLRHTPEQRDFLPHR